MDKFTLFDVLTFLLPGATALLLISWTISAFSFVEYSLNQYPTEVLIIASIVPAYFLGFIFNTPNSKINPKRKTDESLALIEKYLKQAGTIEEWNSLSVKYFNISLTKTDSNGTTVFDSTKLDTFYQMAYEVLSLTNNVALPNLLYAQNKLLLNLKPVAYLGLAGAVIVGSQEIALGNLRISPYWATGHMIEALIIAAASLLVIATSQKLADQRGAIKISCVIIKTKAFFLIKEKKLNVTPTE